MTINQQISISKHSRSAFTMLEMLVVISIIGILMGLLLPVLNAARHRARVARARKEVGELRDAWLAYRLQYKRFPPDISMMDSNAIAILRGDSENPHPANPRAIQYLDLRRGLRYYSDPWGTPNDDERAYRVALDRAGENKVTVSRGGQSYELEVPVAIWSIGRRGEGLKDDDVTSWEGGWQ